MPVTILSDPPEPPALLATVEELEAMLNTRKASNPSELALLKLYLAGASNAVADEVGRRFAAWPPMPEPTEAEPNPPPPAPITEAIPMHGQLHVRIPDVRELTEVRVDGRVIAPSAPGSPGGYHLFARDGQPAHAILVPAAGEWLEIVGLFGFHPVPPDVRAGVLTWAHRAYEERVARQADAISDPEGGGASYFRQIPAGILAMLNRYRIPGL